MDSTSFKIVSWNINGIKSITTSLKEFLDSFQADIICFQETKTTRDQIDEATVNVSGYTSYFSFSKRRSGYSGVATFCKDSVRPSAAEEGLSGLLVSGNQIESIGSCCNIKESFGSDTLQALDAEGRAILTAHKLRFDNSEEADVIVINVYCPRADPERPDRKEYKLNFYKLLQCRAEAILDSGRHVIIVGDVNTSHRPIDRCEVEVEETFHLEPSRVWLDGFLYDAERANEGKFIDSFRYFHPSQKNAFTVWSTITNARENNYGHRIDYIFADVALVKRAMIDSVIMPDIRGSDHCPVSATFKCESIASTKWPALCTRNWPEFSGKQSKLSNFVYRISKDSSSVETEIISGKHKLLTSKSLSNQKVKQPKLHFFLTPTSKLKSDVSASVKSSEGRTEETYKTEVPEVKPSKACPTVNAWKSLLKGPPPPPLCRGHKEPSVMRVCKKAGQNFKRQFYACARPEGYPNDPNANCNFFQWVNNTKSK